MKILTIAFATLQRIKPRGAFLTAACFLLLTACGGATAEQAGQLEVKWAIGGSTCGAAQISTVWVRIFDASNNEYTNQTAPCQLTDGVLIRDLPAGTYKIVIQGYRANMDFPVFEGSVEGIDVRPGTVTIAPRIELAEKPGVLDVNWKFENGDLCGTNGVDTVFVTVWDVHSNRVLDESLPCDYLPPADTTSGPGLPSAVPDTSMPPTTGYAIDWLYAGQYTVRAFAMRAGVDLHPQFWAESKPVVTHAQVTPVTLVLRSCEGVTICQ